MDPSRPESRYNMLQHHERADTCDEADADGYRIVVYSTVVRIVGVCLPVPRLD